MLRALITAACLAAAAAAGAAVDAAAAPAAQTAAVRCPASTSGLSRALHRAVRAYRIDRRRYRTVLRHRATGRARRTAAARRAIRSRSAVRRLRRCARASAASAASAPARPLRSSLRVGAIAQTFGWGNDAGREQAVVAQTGVGWIREEIMWSRIERSQGEYDWSQADRTIGAAAEHDLQVLPLVMDTPRWTGDSELTIPKDPRPYAEFVARFVARYGSGGTYWQANPDLDPHPTDWVEVWNEPFLENFSDGGVDPARYARLVRATAQAARAANPAAKLLLAADTSSTNDFSSYRSWIPELYAAVPDLNRYFDAIAVHPYGGDPGASAAERSPRWRFGRLAEIRKAFVARGAADKHLWITEMGWSTGRSCESDCYSDAEQARFLAKTGDLLNTRYRGYVDAFFLYGWRDLGRDQSNKEDWFGIIRHDGSRKPAWRVLQQLTERA